MNYQEYFDEIQRNIVDAYELANICKSKGFDPELKVATPLAQNMVERVVGLISVIAPQITNTS